MSKQILVVEDDAALAEVLCHNLEHWGFRVEHVSDGNRAIDVARRMVPDLALLDLMLPGRDGYDLCKGWRHEHEFPIIIITARDRKQDRLQGLNLGADDYITKPFDLDELHARINAVLRRVRPVVSQLQLGATHIDFVAFTATSNDRPISLTRREFGVLRYLAERQNRIVHRDELLREVWGYPAVPDTRSVDKAIARLRQKIESDPHHPSFVHTAHGDGYWLTVGGSQEQDK